MSEIAEITSLPEHPQVYDLSKTNEMPTENINQPAGIGSIDDLRQKAPPLYKAIVESIAYEICSKQNASNERIKKTLNEQKRN